MKVLFSLLVFLVAGSFLAAQETVNAVCFSVSPFVLENPTKATGKAVEWADKIFHSAQINTEIKILPLPRALEQLNQGGTVIIFLTRTPEREMHYQWVCEMYEDSISFATLSNKAVISSLEEGKKLEKILVRKDATPELFLKRNNFTNLDNGATDEKINLDKLLAGRGSAWFSSTANLFYLRAASNNTGKMQIGPAIQKLPFWMAASMDVSPTMVAKLRKAAQDLQSSGEFKKAFIFN